MSKSPCGITKQSLDDAYNVVKSSPHCIRSPLLKDVAKLGFIKPQDDVKVHFKLENMQTSGAICRLYYDTEWGGGGAKRDWAPLASHRKYTLFSLTSI